MIGHLITVIISQSVHLSYKHKIIEWRYFYKDRLNPYLNICIFK